VGDAGGEIDDARAARRHAHAGLLRETAVGLAHQRRRLLVAHVDRADAFLDAGGLRQQHRPAHQKEQVLGAFPLERLRQDFRAGQLRHGRLLPCGVRPRARPAATRSLRSARGAWPLPPRDDLLLYKRVDLALAEPEPAFQHLGRMLPQHGRSLHGRSGPVVADRPGRHHVAFDGRVIHGLQDAALVEGAVLGQLLGVQHRARRDAGGADDAHRLVLVVLDGPRRDDGVDLLLALGAVGGCLVALVADEVLAADHMQQPLPVLGVGAAGVDVDVVVGSAALALEDAARRIAARYGLIAGALDRPALARLGGEGQADVVQHGVLHGELQALTLARALLLIERAEYGDGEQHAGAGVAQRGARLDGPAVRLAGDAHDAAGGLGDHVEGEVVLER